MEEDDEEEEDEVEVAAAAAPQDRGTPPRAEPSQGKEIEAFTDVTGQKSMAQEADKGMEMYTELPLHSLDLKAQEDIFSTLQSGE